MTIIRRITLLAALLALSLSACAQEAPALLEPVGVQLATAQAQVTDMFKITVYDGAIVPHVEEVSFSVDGVIEDIPVIAGQAVKKGDTLMTLDTQAQQRQRESIERQLDALRSEDSYARELARIDLEILALELDGLLAASPQDESAIALKRLDIEEFELNAALEADLRALEMETLAQQLGRLEADSGAAILTAPCDGRIMYVGQLNTGDRVNAYAPIVYLADESRLTLESAFISEASIESAWEMYALIDGRRHEIEYVPMDKSEYISRVLSGGSLVSRFLIDAQELRAGDYAAVCVASGRVENALVIPRNALYSDASGKYVYIVEDGVRTRRGVQTGLINEWQAQILSGLEEGEIVYVQD